MMKIALAVLLTGVRLWSACCPNRHRYRQRYGVVCRLLCLGRYQQTQKDLGLSGIASVDEVITRDFFQRITQLRAYLHAHGLDKGARSALAKTGVGDAMLRGRADASSCWTTIEGCVKECTKPQPVGYDTMQQRLRRRKPGMSVGKALLRRASVAAMMATISNIDQK